MSSDIDRLVELTTDPESKLPSAYAAKLATRCLVPRENISSRAAYRIVGCLASTVEISTTVKTQLLRWLVIVHEFLDDKSCIVNLYPILMANLRYESYRRWVCHLLFLSSLESGDRIKKWNCDYVLEKYRTAPDSLYLRGLLSLFQTIAPQHFDDSVVMVSLKPNTFQHPDMDLRDKIRLLLQQSSEERLVVPAPAYKKRKVDVPKFDLKNPEFSIYTVSNEEEFAQNVEKFQFPLQIGSVLEGNTFIKWLLLYNPRDNAWRRFNTWLRQEGVLESENIVSLLKRFCEDTKILPLAAEGYIYSILDSGDFVKCDPDLLEYFSPPESIDKLLDPLQSSTRLSLQTLAEILPILSRLCLRWGIDEFTRRFNDFANICGTKILQAQYSVDAADKILSVYEHNISLAPSTELTDMLINQYSISPSWVARITCLTI
ncbi:hypothetical protein TRVA0_014S00672 [Trichomonascus vanleenenianus]|uniref:uncharacterized protein n=1 Tax=Trichomonascus vanleenenianus TaxID=2268995 RepID=UPI003ECBA68B